LPLYNNYNELFAVIDKIETIDKGWFTIYNDCVKYENFSFYGKNRIENLFNAIIFWLKFNSPDINQKDEFGRRQGLWINYYPTGQLYFKSYWYNGGIINYSTAFYYYSGQIIVREDFYHNIF
jgi:hypothetical protein